MSENIANYDEMKNYENSDNVLIIDVRREEEVNSTGKIGGSINIPIDSLEDVFVNVNEKTFKEQYGKSKPNKDFPLIFTCLMGGRAARAVDIVAKLGYTNLKFYKGSWMEWEAKMNASV